MDPLSDEQAHAVYVWVDKHTLSRPKRNIARDFADGVLVAEILKFYFPQIVDLHNYVSSFSQRQKVENWLTLKQKVFRRIGLEVDPKDLTDIANAIPMAIERFLLVLMEKIPAIEQRMQAQQQQAHLHQQAQLQHAQQQVQAQAQQQQQNGSKVRSSSSRDVSADPQRGQRSSSQLGKSAPASGRAGAAAAAADRPGSARSSSATAAADGSSNNNNTEVVLAKDHEIANLRESTRLLTAKIRQLEELLKLRDSKIRILQDQVVQLQSQ